MANWPLTLERIIQFIILMISAKHYYRGAFIYLNHMLLTTVCLLTADSDAFNRIYVRNTHLHTSAHHL